jgi:hypothetical protein
MIHAANTVTYNLADDDKTFNNKEMASDSLECHVMQSPNKKTEILIIVFLCMLINIWMRAGV